MLAQIFVVRSNLIVLNCCYKFFIKIFYPKGWIPKFIPIQYYFFNVAQFVHGFTTKPMQLA